MVGFLLRAAITALGLWVASEIFDGLQFASPSKLVVAAVLLGVVNAFVRPLAFILTLPLTVLSLGLFLLVLNAAMVGLVAWMVPGFEISGFWTAVGAALDREPRLVGCVERHRVERQGRGIHRPEVGPPVRLPMPCRHRRARPARSDHDDLEKSPVRVLRPDRAGCAGRHLGQQHRVSRPGHRGGEPAFLAADTGRIQPVARSRSTSCCSGLPSSRGCCSRPAACRCAASGSMCSPASSSPSAPHSRHS